MKFILYVITILISIFIGYENPELIDIPKKFIKLKTEKPISEKKLEEFDLNNTDDKQEIYFANSFIVKLKKIKNFDNLSAGLFVSYDDKKSIDYKIYTQNGFLIKKNTKQKVNLPITFYKEEEKNGGIKSVFISKGIDFALISEKKLNCLYASIINLKTLKRILETDCIPDQDNVNFAGLGGAYIKKNNILLISIGTPTHYSDEINNLSLKDNVFGKILELDLNEIVDNSFEYNNYQYFSTGHRNPQGLTINNGKIYSVEHGPQGGDELNEISKGNNYGWPIVSFGTRYGNGKSYEKNHIKKYAEPIFTFLPSIAPSALNICPKNLKDYYEGYDCLIGLSLKEMSLIVYILFENRLISYEKILINKRLRHFGLEEEKATIFLDEDENFFITSDNDGVYKIKFDNFR
jgi:hypothetical protein